jgi:hypothetical protein
MFSKLAWPLLLLLAPAHAFAGAPPAVGMIPLPVELPQPFAVQDFGQDLEPACTAIYLNESVSSGLYAPVAANVELADDLHTSLVGAQVLCGFDLGYYKPGTGLVDATVTFYANAPIDAGRGAVLAGPYVVHGLPAGLNAFHIEVGGGMLQTDLWVGVAFSDALTGMLCFSPPSLGASHDVIWFTPPELPSGIATNFGGNPTANLFLGVYTSPATPARAATWGSLKAHYR